MALVNVVNMVRIYSVLFMTYEMANAAKSFFLVWCTVLWLLLIGINGSTHGKISQIEMFS